MAGQIRARTKMQAGIRARITHAEGRRMNSGWGILAGFGLGIGAAGALKLPGALGMAMGALAGVCGGYLAGLSVLALVDRLRARGADRGGDGTAS